MKDLGLEGEWNFFVTSHRKRACDEIGGTVKRLLTKPSCSVLTQTKFLPLRLLWNSVLQISQEFTFSTFH